MPRAKALAVCGVLSADKKARYGRKAARAEERFMRKVEECQDLHPGWKAPLFATKTRKTPPSGGGGAHNMRKKQMFLTTSFCGNHRIRLV